MHPESASRFHSTSTHAFLGISFLFLCIQDKNPIPGQERTKVKSVLLSMITYQLIMVICSPQTISVLR